MKIERVCYELKRKITETIQNDLRDPRLHSAGIITVMSVETSKDLDLAKIYISVFANETPAEVILDILNGSSNHIRKLLYDRMRIRKVPVLRFYIDNTIDHAYKIDNIMTKIKTDENQNESE